MFGSWRGHSGFLEDVRVEAHQKNGPESRTFDFLQISRVKVMIERAEEVVAPGGGGGTLVLYIPKNLGAKSHSPRWTHCESPFLFLPQHA